MSYTYRTYLMIGIKTTPEELGINIWDDKWLPYIEGDKGIDIKKENVVAYLKNWADKLEKELNTND